MNINCPDALNPRRMIKINRPQLKLFIALVTIIILSAGTLPLAGCQTVPSWEGDIRANAANKLADTTVASLAEWDKEINRIDGMLDAVETRLQKLEQVAEPVLKWVELQKANAIKEQCSPQLLEITNGLNEVKNDQFKVVKVQLFIEMCSTGMKYTPVILIGDITTSETSPYEKLRDEYQDNISVLLQQREAIVNVRNTARTTGLSVVEQNQNWKAKKINSTTFIISGPGLGMNQSLTEGSWTYYLGASNQLVPADTAAQSLKRVLTGK